jgi:hypothetical protein
MFRHQVEAGVLLENRCRYPELVKRQHPIEEGVAQRRKPWVEKGNDTTLKGRKNA